jgi:hypothetical protein
MATHGKLRRRSHSTTALMGVIPKLTVRLAFASSGASGSTMDREGQERPLSAFGRGGFHPLAIGQDRPSRLGPAGEGRSDSRVLHLHPQGQARYPGGGRRREDEPRKVVTRPRQCRKATRTWSAST